jgi:hypothetical protein
MHKKILALIFSIGLLTGTIAAQFPFWGDKNPKPFGTPPDSLRHGQFTWEPGIAPAGPIFMIVSLDEQVAYTYRNGLLIGKAMVSTGKTGHVTPTGVFVTLQKDLNHHSNKYNNAAMPYTQRLTNYGIALHAGGIPGYPSSHGCIHLPSAYAKLLFEAAPLGMTVLITSKKTAPEEVNHPDFLSPIDKKGKRSQNPRLANQETFRWEPEKMTNGPLSMVISTSDRRMVVLRNGIEIGRSKVTINGSRDSISSQVMIANFKDSSKVAGLTWNRIPFNIRPDNGKLKKVNPLLGNRVVIPALFLEKLAPLIGEGTSLVITDGVILPQTTGLGLSLLTSSPISAPDGGK